jgi:hypothetical protein
MGQLEIVQHRGIIAVNVDVYFSDLHPSQGPVDLIGQFQHRLEILDIAAKVLSDKPAIVGLLACGFVAGWDRSENGWRYDVLYPTRWMSLHGDDPVDVKLAKRLAQTLERMQYRAREIEAQVPKPRSF